MVNGLGIVGWSVGGVEAECVMLGQAINILLPQVIGYKIVGTLNELCTSTDLVLTIIKVLILDRYFLLIIYIHLCVLSRI